MVKPLLAAWFGSHTREEVIELHKKRYGNEPTIVWRDPTCWHTGPIPQKEDIDDSD